MNNRSKIDEVQFYLDRTIDSAVLIMKSIVGNPRISPAEQIEALRVIADFHGSISLDLQTCIHGKAVHLSLKESEPLCKSGSVESSR